MQVSSPPWITPLLYFIIIFVCTFLVAYFSGMAVPGKPSPWPFCCLCHSLSVSLKEYHAWLPPQPQVFAGQYEHDSCFSTFWLHQTTCLKLLNIALATISRQCQSTSLHAWIQNSQTLVWPQASIANVKKTSVSNRAHYLEIELF